MKSFKILCLSLLWVSQGNCQLLDQLTLLLQQLQQLQKGLSALPPALVPVPGPTFAASFRLPALTAAQQAAGVEGSQFYSKKLTRVDYNILHSSGDTVETNFLKNFFLRTIFQYYTAQFVGVDPNIEYTDYALRVAENHDLLRYDEIISKFGFDETNFIENVLFIILAIQNFANNKLLQDIGTAFQRKKVIVEKINTAVNQRVNEGVFDEITENLGRKLYEQDRIATDLQAMIYHMMKSGYEQFIKNFKAATTQNEKMKAGEFLKAYQPDFIDAPYYRNLINRLAELMQPSP